MKAQEALHDSPEGQNGKEGKQPRPDQQRAKASHRLPILSLVDREYLHSTANLPRAAWEPLSFLYSEADSEVARLQGTPATDTQEEIPPMVVPPELEWQRERALVDWNKMHRWLDQLLLDSQSVEALRSWQMVGGLQSQNADLRRPSATVMPDFPRPQHPGNQGGTPGRGLKLRGGSRQQEQP